MFLLIDGDILIYRCGFAAEKTKYLTEEGGVFSHFENAKDAKAHSKDAVLWSRKEVEPLSHALAMVKNVIEDIQDRHAEFSGTRIWLTPSTGNFREAVSTRTKYKGNRDGQQRPVHYSAIRDYLVDNWGAQYTVGQEADDAIGIDMYSYPGSTCVSIDKDLLQLAGRHYNWVDRREIKVTEREASLNFWTQVIAGDATDNIPGVEGMGPVKAKRALADVKSNKEAWDVVHSIYCDTYGMEQGAEYALETARLVYVRRKEHEIWNPPV